METIARITKNDILSVNELVTQMSLYLPSIGDTVSIEDGITDHQLAVLIKIADEEMADDILGELKEAGFGVEIVTNIPE